jgi:hypothetical protein
MAQNNVDDFSWQSVRGLSSVNLSLVTRLLKFIYQLLVVYYIQYVQIL